MHHLMVCNLKFKYNIHLSRIKHIPFIFCSYNFFLYASNPPPLAGPHFDETTNVGQGCTIHGCHMLFMVVDSTMNLADEKIRMELCKQLLHATYSQAHKLMPRFKTLHHYKDHGSLPLQGVSRSPNLVVS